MFWNGKEYCDHCHLPLLDDDKVSVKIPRGEKTYIFKYHNRTASDCLAITLAELKKKFESQPSQPTPAPSR
jgi:hypothetical protein